MDNELPDHTNSGFNPMEPSSRLARHRPATSDVGEEADSESESDVSLDLASTAASGSENRLYLRLALYAGGNILTLLLVLGLWTVWSLLATFRNPMLWALLCSTALQDVKEDLVVYLNRKLTQERCALPENCRMRQFVALLHAVDVTHSLSLLFLPLGVSSRPVCCSCGCLLVW